MARSLLDYRYRLTVLERGYEMFDDMISEVFSAEDMSADYGDELLAAIHYLFAAGMTYRSISEFLNIHEAQVKELLEYPRHKDLH